MKSIYEACFYGGLVLAILLFITAVVLFIVLKIPKAIGDLTGTTAKREIKEKKEGGVAAAKETKSVSKKERAKYYNEGTGKIKVRETVSNETRKENRDDTTDLLGKSDNVPYDGDETEVLGAGKYKNTNAKDEDATEVLNAGTYADGGETEVLSFENSVDDNATDVLKSGDDDATDVLKSEDDDATDVLTSGDDDDATDVLTSGDYDDDATDVLTSGDYDDDATDVLTSGDYDDDATDVLRASETAAYMEEDEDATSVLVSEPIDGLSKRAKVLCNVVVVHTDEKLD